MIVDTTVGSAMFIFVSVCARVATCGCRCNQGAIRFNEGNDYRVQYFWCDNVRCAVESVSQSVTLI